VAGSRFDDMLVYVASRATDGDGGEGYWRFDAASSATANGGTILAPDAGTGRWIRQYADTFLSSWFATLQSAIDAAATTTLKHLIVNQDYTVTTPLSITTAGMTIEGIGSHLSRATRLLKSGTGNILNSSASSTVIKRIFFEHNTNSGRMLNLSDGEFHDVSECRFVSDNAVNTDPALYFRGSFVDVHDNAFVIFGSVAARYAIECDRLTGLINIESQIIRNEIGGTSSGIRVLSSDASARPEGIIVAHNSFLCTGDNQLRVDCILQILITDNVFDQTGARAIALFPDSLNIDTVQITNNWLGSTAAAGKFGVDLVSVAAGLAKRVIVANNNFAYLGWGVTDTAGKIYGLTINANTFSLISDGAIVLGDTRDVSIIGNILSDLDASAVNLILSDGASGGPFYVAGNHFDPAHGETITRTNGFKFTFDGNYGRKYSGRSSGVIDASASGSGTLVIPHGITLAPSVQKVQATLLEASGAHIDYYFRLYSVDATNCFFEVFWTTVAAGDLRINVYAEV